MKSAEILSNTDRTSWSRIMMVWKFFMPILKKKLIFLPAFALLIESNAYAAGYMLPEGDFMFIFMLMSAMTVALIILSPIVFAKVRGREVLAMLPALGFEKSIVVIGYCAVIVPLLICLPGMLLALLIDQPYPVLSVMDAIMPSLNGDYLPAMVLSVTILEGGVLSCLLGVLLARHYSMLTGILYAGLYFFGFLGLTVSVSFFAGFYTAVFDIENATAEAIMPKVFYILSAICGIYAIFALLKCNRVISSGQY